MRIGRPAVESLSVHALRSLLLLGILSGPLGGQTIVWKHPAALAACSRGDRPACAAGIAATVPDGLRVRYEDRGSYMKVRALDGSVRGVVPWDWVQPAR